MLLSTLIIALLYKLREFLIKSDYFLSFDDLLEVTRDAFIKHKFSFKTLYKDLKRAWYRCAIKKCFEKVNTYLNHKNSNKVIVNLITLIYICISDATAKEEAASC
jgi:hypothetical protein